MDTDATMAASAWGLLLLVAGVYFCVRMWRNPKGMPARGYVAPWETSWRDFGLTIWVGCAVFFMGALGLGALPIDPESEGAVLVSGTVVQGSFLAGIIAAFAVGKSGFYAGLSARSLGAWRSLLDGVRHYLAFLPLLALTSAGMLLAVRVWNHFGIDYTPAPQEILFYINDSESPLFIAAMAVFAVVVAPVLEETLFRGTLYRFLKAKIGPLAALVSANACFGAVHLDFDAFLPLCAAGMFFTWAYERTGNLRVPIVCHMCLNANTFFMLVVAGGDLPL